jgi:hypothetical protein
MMQLIIAGTVVGSAYVKSIEVEKQEKRGADSCRFVVSKNVSVNVGDDCKVKELVGNTYIFGGRVIEVSKSYGGFNCVALSYGKVFDEIRVFPSLVYINNTPEYIVNDLRAKYFNDFTLNSVSSGVTIRRYEATGTISENLKILADIAGFDFWTEVSSTGAKQLYFRPANTNLNRTLYLGKVGTNNPNAFRESVETDDSMLFNAVEVYGRGKNENVYYRWDSTYENASYYFARTLSSVGVTLRDVVLNEGVDYVYNIDSKFVNLNTLTGATSTNTSKVEITGVADVTPLGYGENSSSISTYGKRSAAVFIDKETSQTDINAFVNKFLSLYSNVRLTLKIKKPGLDFGIKNGGYVTVYDPYLGISGATYVVRVVRWKYPEGVTEMVLAQFEPELYDFQRDTRFRLETASKSYVQLRDIGIMEKKFYLSGSGTTFTLEELPQNIVSGSAEILPGTPPAWIRLRLQVIGSTTTDYNTIYTAPAYIYDTSTTSPVRAYYMSPLNVSERLANASNQITLRAQFYVRNNYSSSTEFIIGPSSTSTSYFFTTTVSGVSKMLATSIGGVLYVSTDFNNYGYRLHWSNSNPSHLFGFGFKKA